MSELFENAIDSVTLGIEDFKTELDKRMLSAARNYYAGLLLLAKECLVQTAPEADAMEVIGAKFKPIPDGDGGVEHIVQGYSTVDLHHLQQRFKDFGLPWPNANIKKLQEFRNDLEHYHLKEPVSALGEAIAASFPMIVDFFEILGESPQEHLPEVWETILSERAAFEKIQSSCLASWEDVEWPTDIKDLDKMSCPHCKSSLIGQADNENVVLEEVTGQCFQCGAEFSHEHTMELVVSASFEIDAYLMAKDGLNSPIGTCPECWNDAYVDNGEVSICFACGESIAGECIRCSTTIDLNEYNSDYPNLCSYCAHMLEKVMSE